MSEAIFDLLVGQGAIGVALVVMVIALVGAISGAQVSIHDRRQRGDQERRESKLRERILNRLSNDIEVTIKDFERFRNALELNQHQAKRVLDAIYSEELSEEVTAAVIEKLDALLGDLEAKQPFDNLPAEVRPSLIRIEKTLSASPDEEDKAVLTPVVNTLHSYVELVRQKRRLGLHRNIAYGIGAASLIIGLAALLLSPSADDLAKRVAAEIAQSAPETENTSPGG